MDSTPHNIVRQAIARADITAMAESRFSDMVKAVVDVARGVMSLGGELHSDDEAALISDGSRQSDLWGINLYPAEAGENWIEFDSMINVRPAQGNRSRGVESDLTRQAIRRVVASPGVGQMTAIPTYGPELASRWASFTLMEQFAHVGSEVDRAIRANNAGNTTRFDHALSRALELFDLTAMDAHWHGHRCREILRAREEFCRLFFDENVPAASASGLQRYFLYFAIAARKQHGTPAA